MALRNIIQEGDPTLTKPSRRVEVFDERLHILLDDMRETMRKVGGVGIAAPQVGVLRRVVLVTDIRDDGEEIKERVLELINPEILEEEGEVEGFEGCLSVPDVRGLVKRPHGIRLRAQDRHGAFFELECRDFTARVACHEVDHLEGLLYTRLCDELIDADILAELEAEED